MSIIGERVAEYGYGMSRKDPRWDSLVALLDLQSSTHDTMKGISVLALRAIGVLMSEVDVIGAAPLEAETAVTMISRGLSLLPEAARAACGWVLPSVKAAVDMAYGEDKNRRDAGGKALQGAVEAHCEAGRPRP